MVQEGIFWLVLLILFLIVEANTVAVVSIWFAAGALSAIVAALLGAEFWLQVVLFFGVSGLLLACLRPVVKKYFTPKLTATNVDSVIGQQGVVTKKIDNDAACGTVKLGAMEWSARSTAGEILEPGSKVQVDRVEGVKLFVTLAQVPAGK